MAEPRRKKRTRPVNFEIRTAAPLSVGEQVFITGSDAELGRWQADGFPLTRMGENVWAGTATLPGHEDVEFKVTRGSWDTEEVGADGVVPGNSTLKAGGDTTVRRSVAGWRDQVK